MWSPWSLYACGCVTSSSSSPVHYSTTCVPSKLMPYLSEDTTPYPPKTRCALERRSTMQWCVRGAPPDDQLVINLVSALLEPPSDHMIKVVRPISQTVQSIEVNNILGDMVSTFRHGFLLILWLMIMIIMLILETWPVMLGMSCYCCYGC